MGLASRYDLLGLFQGIGLPFRHDVTGTMPNMIWLYRRPILAYWTEHEESLAGHRHPCAGARDRPPFRLLGRGHGGDRGERRIAAIDCGMRRSNTCIQNGRIGERRPSASACRLKEIANDRHRFPLPPDAGLERRIRRAGRPHGRARQAACRATSRTRASSAEDGERCTIVEFESEEAQRAWRMHPEHREAQRKAREIYYETYSLQICELKRESEVRPQSAHGSRVASRY